MRKKLDYMIIKPSVYEKLGWHDMDFVVQFLEAVRRDMEGMGFQWAIKTHSVRCYLAFLIFTNLSYLHEKPRMNTNHCSKS